MPLASAGEPVVAVHGITAHGRRFRRLAEEAWPERHTVSVDLRPLAVGRGKYRVELSLKSGKHSKRFKRTYKVGRTGAQSQPAWKSPASQRRLLQVLGSWSHCSPQPLL
mgnify:CR=1 FL=1